MAAPEAPADSDAAVWASRDRRVGPHTGESNRILHSAPLSGRPCGTRHAGESCSRARCARLWAGPASGSPTRRLGVCARLGRTTTAFGACRVAAWRSESVLRVGPWFFGQTGNSDGTAERRGSVPCVRSDRSGTRAPGARRPETARSESRRGGPGGSGGEGSEVCPACRARLPLNRGPLPPAALPRTRTRSSPPANRRIPWREPLAPVTRKTRAEARMTVDRDAAGNRPGDGGAGRQRSRRALMGSGQAPAAARPAPCGPALAAAGRRPARPTGSGRPMPHRSPCQCAATAPRRPRHRARGAEGSGSSGSLSRAAKPEPPRSRPGPAGRARPASGPEDQGAPARRAHGLRVAELGALFLQAQ